MRNNIDLQKLEKKNSFVITRFNLKLFSRDKNNKTTLTDQWLKERFELFETYCYPSVKGQKLQNFYWICLFADDTPDVYKQRVKALRDSYKAFLPLYLNEEQTKSYLSYVNMVIFELSGGGILLQLDLITTTLSI